MDFEANVIKVFQSLKKDISELKESVEIISKKVSEVESHKDGTNKKTVLITGGAGFIGSHTADLMAKRGYKIKIFDNLDKQVHSGEWPAYVKNKGYELIVGDVTNKNEFRQALVGVDYVLYLAAHQDQLPNFSKFYDVNTKGLTLLYEIILENNFPIKKIVYASSQFVYGDGAYIDSRGKKFYPDLRDLDNMKKHNFEIVDSYGKKAKFIPFDEDQEVKPTNSYGLSKRASEHFILRVAKTLNIPTAIARYSIVQGPRQSPKNIYSGALRIFVTQALAGEPISVYEDGLQKRDFVNVEDVARANLLLLESDETNFEIYNVGGGKGYSVLDFAELVKEITKSSSKIIIQDFRKTDTRNAVSDISKLRSLGWMPQNTPEKSISDYVAWIKEQNFDFSTIKQAKKKLKEMGVIDS